MSEEKFEQIATQAVTEAEGVECSLEEFADGLRAMISVLQERYEQVNDELGR